MRIGPTVAAAIGIVLFALSANAAQIAPGQQTPAREVGDILVAFDVPGIAKAVKTPRPQYTIPVQGFKCSNSATPCCCMSPNSNTTQCMAEADCKGDAGPWAGGMCVGPVFPPGGVTDGCQ